MQRYIEVGAWTIAVLCGGATIYPYVLYPLLLRGLPAQPPFESAIGSDSGREFALLFCAHNEVKALAKKIENLRQLKAVYPELEILAYDDFSSDGTADILEKASADIRVVRGTRRAGKAHGMKILASMTEREFLIFTDANVELAADAVDRLRVAYGDSNVGGICGLLEYVDPDGTPVAEAGGLYWRLEEKIKTLESRSGNVMGADGSIFSIRKVLYPQFPDSVLDDLTVSMSVIFQGFRLIKDPSVVAREELVGSRSDDVRRRIRIATRAFHTHVWMRSKLRKMSNQDRWRYWSHRYVRWHGAFFLLSGYAAALLAMVAGKHWPAALTVLAASIAVASLGTYFRFGPLSAPVHMCASILLTGLGVLRARQGRTVTTWKSPTR
ncbi:MAG: glycosyltransferase [Actinomycetota bacterium]|nr:glycosyltransferase [Actinomycetota bacterium]